MRSVLVMMLAALALAEEPPVTYPGPQDAPPGDRFNPGQLHSTLVVHETPVARFRSPVIDTHSHAYAKTPDAIAEWVEPHGPGERPHFVHPHRRDRRRFRGSAEQYAARSSRAAS